MNRKEYIEQCRLLVDAFDDYVDGGMVVFTLRYLADQVESEGLDDA